MGLHSKRSNKDVAFLFPKPRAEYFKPYTSATSQNNRTQIKNTDLRTQFIFTVTWITRREHFVHRNMKSVVVTPGYAKFNKISILEDME